MAEQSETKWVLVRATKSGALFVVEREWFKEVERSGSHKGAEIVASSNDRDELMRFKDLTQED